MVGKIFRLEKIPDHLRHTFLIRGFQIGMHWQAKISTAMIARVRGVIAVLILINHRRVVLLELQLHQIYKKASTASLPCLLAIPDYHSLSNARTILNGPRVVEA